MQEEAAAQRREVAKHAEFNAHCRSVIAWWKFHVIDARSKLDLTQREGNAFSREGGMPLICIVHCNDEASRKIPHCRFDSEGGGFDEGRLRKNVTFADMVRRLSSSCQTS